MVREGFAKGNVMRDLGRDNSDKSNEITTLLASIYTRDWKMIFLTIILMICTVSRGLFEAERRVNQE